MTIGFATSKIPVKKITFSKFKNPVTRMTATESRATRKGATVLEEGADGVFRVPENAAKSPKNIPKSLPHTTASNTTEAISYTRNVERIAQTAGNVAENLSTVKNNTYSGENYEFIMNNSQIKKHHNEIIPKNGELSGGHDLEIVDNFFLNQLKISEGKVTNIPEYKISNVKEIYDDVFEVQYQKLRMLPGNKIPEEISYKNIKSSKTVHDTKKIDVDKLEHSIENNIKNTITPEEIKNAITRGNDIGVNRVIDGKSMRIYIKVNPDTKKIEITNYHFRNPNK